MLETKPLFLDDFKSASRVEIGSFFYTCLVSTPASTPLICLISGSIDDVLDDLLRYDGKMNLLCN